jgi:hypothetical protein
MNTQEMISIKVQYQTEIRRFALPSTADFSAVAQTVANLFSIQVPIVIKFIDDEDDLCTISTQEEWIHAGFVGKSKSPLRLQLFLRDAPASAPASDTQYCSLDPASAPGSCPVTRSCSWSNKCDWKKKSGSKCCGSGPCAAGSCSTGSCSSGPCAAGSCPVTRSCSWSNKCDWKCDNSIQSMREKQESIRSRLPPETDGCGKWKRERMLQKIQNLEDRIQAMEARKADPQQPQRCGSRKWCHNDSNSTCSAKNSCERLESSVKALREKQEAIRAALPSEQDTKYCAVQKRACMLQKIQKIDDKIKFLEAKKAQAADPQNPKCQGKKWCTNDSTPCQ